MSLRWSAVLDDQLAANALERATRIGIFIREQIETMKYADHLCDASLLFSELYLNDRNDEWFEAAVKALNAAGGLVSNFRGRLGLYGGIAGFAWKYRLCASKLSDIHGIELDSVQTADLLSEIDVHLYSALRDGIWSGEFDLISGSAGIGMYLASRPSSPAVRGGLELIVEHIQACSERADSGCIWRTRLEHIIATQREGLNRGWVDCGVAHGIFGVIGSLTKIAKYLDFEDMVAPLLNLGIHGALGLSRKTELGSAYPDILDGHRDSLNSRLGWCYGDVGIAGVLLSVGVARNEASLLDKSKELLFRSSIRTPEQGGVNDHALCHGSIGIAHIWNRFYQVTDDPKAKEIAKCWYTFAMSETDDGRGVAGFSSYQPAMSDLRQADTSFLSGAVGIALGLLAASSSSEPGWDEVLLLS